MGGNVLVTAMAAAIGAAAGIAICYIVFDASVTMIKFNFIDYLRYRDDWILWGVLGAIGAAVLSLMHK